LLPTTFLEEAFNLYKENAEDQDLQDELKATYLIKIGVLKI